MLAPASNVCPATTWYGPPTRGAYPDFQPSNQARRSLKPAVILGCQGSGFRNQGFKIQGVGSLTPDPFSTYSVDRTCMGVGGYGNLGVGRHAVRAIHGQLARMVDGVRLIRGRQNHRGQ